VAALCIAAPPSAFGQGDFVQLAAGPIYLTNPVLVGQTNIAAKFRFSNSSSGALTIDTLAADARVNYVPSCGSSANAAGSPPCQGANQDPGVFTISATGTGQTIAGTTLNCDATTFTFTATGDAAGTIKISSAANLQLGLGAVCDINFTILSVVKVPTVDASVAAGRQTLGVGQALQAFLTTNTQVTGDGTGSSIVTVEQCPTPGVTCRAAVNACDVPEVCDANFLCPADLKAAAGTSCGVGTSCTVDQCNASVTSIDDFPVGNVAACESPVSSSCDNPGT